MTPTEFAVKYRPQANTVSAATGIDAFVLLAQWGVETGWGNQINNQNNLGNIRDKPGSFAQLPTLDAFCQLAIATWHNGYYPGVLAAVGPVAQIIAIGESPWDAGHYNSGGGPGSSIRAAYNLIAQPITGGTFDMLSDEAVKNLIFRIEDIHKKVVSSAEASPDSYATNTLPVPPTVAPLDVALGLLKLDVLTFILPILQQLETDIKAVGGGTIDPSIAASLDILKKHLGVGTP